MRRLVELTAPALLILALIAGWEIACRALAIAPYFLPAPSAILVALATDAGALLAAAWNTLSMALAALVVVSATATSAALAAAASPTLERASRPAAVAVQVTPIIAIAPLVSIWAGLDHPERAVIVLAGVVAFFPIFSGTLTGLKSADPDLERLFDLYGAKRLSRLWRLRAPSAVPYILEGHKVAAGQAVVGAVVAEFVARNGASQGLGWRILDAGNRLQTAKMFAALLALAAMGAALYGLLRLIERAALSWQRGR